MNRSLFICLVSGFLLLQGCYGAKVIRQPVTVDDTARDMEALRQLHGDLEQRLKAMERRLGEQSELLRQIKADESLRWQELETRLLAIDSRFRDSATGRQGYADIPIWSANVPGTRTRTADRPASSEPEPVRPGVPQSERDTIPDTPRDSDHPGAGEWRADAHEDPASTIADPAVDDPGAAAPVGRDPEAKRLYDQAYLDLTRGNYSLAILGFREFLRISPGSDLADNAQYWIGECYYAQRDFNQAIREFLTVEERYPGGDKLPAALLKAGYSFQALEDRAAARRYLNEVLTRFPNSDEAVLARNRLRTIG